MRRGDKLRIARVERDADGYWIYLRDGWQDASNPGCHIIVETTARDAYRHDAIPCECRGCVEALAKLERCQCRWACPYHESYGLGPCPNAAEVDVIDAADGELSLCKFCFDPDYQRLR